MSKIKQYGTLVVALMLGGGFAVSGIASFSAINSGLGGNDNSQGFNASMPSEGFQSSAYDLSMREQRVLAYNNDVVFVNAFYGNESQRQRMSQYTELSDRFDGRVYVSLANSSEPSDLKINYGIVDYPAVVVVGSDGPTTPEDTSISAVSETICSGFRSLGQQSAQCL